VERQHAARHQDRANQREERDRLRQIRRLAIAKRAHENKIADNLRRPFLVTSDIGPAASKIFSSCARAAPSFHSRFFSMMVSSCSLAPSRSPRAESASAYSKRAW